MSLKIYNTLTRQKEEFKPINPPKVNMYVCGVTVYDECHLGHARAVVTFDMIYRYLKSKKFEVKYVRNFTDIDDKIINKANQTSAKWNEISEKYIEAFHRDMDGLKNIKPDFEPKATDHIQEMLQLISKLEKNGFAYKAGSDVFYKVRKKSDYGKLSGKKIDELESGARVDVQDVKEDPLDFVLWKSPKPGEPSWDSVWGAGRPGWHIECSAMSMHFLGETLDIHGGGRDLMFPHHENEIAQSEGATNKQFARYWIHNGFININAEKMSKSLGNFLTIRQLLTMYHPEVIRLFILSAHYRSPLDYTETNIQNARASLTRWYTTLKRIQDYQGLTSTHNKELNQKINSLIQDFSQAMDDDFNTSKVCASLFDLARDWNKAMDEKQAISKKDGQTFLKAVEDIHQVLGIFGSNASEFLESDKKIGMTQSQLSSNEIEAKLLDRKLARQNKDWAKADAIRDELADLGIEIKDHPDGSTSWAVN